jgi:hypothetical protein
MRLSVMGVSRAAAQPLLTAFDQYLTTFDLERDASSGGELPDDPFVHYLTTI